MKTIDGNQVYTIARTASSFFFQRKSTTIATEDYQQIYNAIKDLLTLLSCAITFRSIALLEHYLLWLKLRLGAFAITDELFKYKMDCIRRALEAELDQKPAVYFFDEAVKNVQNQEITITPIDENVRTYLNYIMSMDREGALHFIESMMASGMNMHSIYLNILEPALYETGRLWQSRVIDIYQEHYATAVTHAAMSLIMTRLKENNGGGGLSVIAASPSGEGHDLGLRMVCDFFELEGIHTFFLGCNIPTESIYKSLVFRKPDVLCLSLTLPEFLPDVVALIHMIRANPVLTSMKILVGGQVFNIDPVLTEKIGADIYAGSAMDAVKQMRVLL